MTANGRLTAGVASVSVVLIAVLGAWMMAPPRQVYSLFILGMVAVAMAVTSLIANPRELLASLAFASPVLMAAAIEGTGAAWVGLFSVLLLIGAEMNTLSWEFEGARSTPEMFRRRTTGIAYLAALGLVGSTLAYGTTRFEWLSGTAAIVASALCLAGIAFLVLPGHSGGR